MEKERISIEEFVKTFESIDSEVKRQEYVKSLLCNLYISYNQKISRCEAIINNTYYKNQKGAGNQTYKVFHVNSPAKYMFFCLTLVDLYFNVHIDFKNGLDTYDSLNQLGAMDLFFASVPEKEFKEMGYVLEMVENDLMRNERDFYSFIENQGEKLANILSFLNDSPLFTDLLKKLDTK